MGQLVSANYFSTLGVDPVVGRGFRAEEEVAGRIAGGRDQPRVVDAAVRRQAGCDAAGRSKSAVTLTALSEWRRRDSRD